MRDLFEGVASGAGLDINRWHDTDEQEGGYLDEMTDKLWSSWNATFGATNGFLFRPSSDGALDFSLFRGTFDTLSTAVASLLHRVFSSEEMLAAVTDVVVRRSAADELTKEAQELGMGYGKES